MIKSLLKDIPTSSGIYQMIDKNGKIIYIGKAKNLQKRVSNYTKSDLPYRTYLMSSLIADIKVITTNSESEAFILEASLIKKLQPKYNILLKDDKSFPYLKIRIDHIFPQILKYRGKKSKDELLFGPYPSVAILDSVIVELQKIFKIRSCSDNYFSARKRPCLQYQIKRCSAPCVNKISQSDYMESITYVEKFLKGKTQSLQTDLAIKMQQYSEECEYEKAAEIRDKIKALSYVQSKAIAADFNIENTDIIALYEENNNYVIEILMLRSGGASGSRSFFPENTENATISEILESFLSYFYQNITPPLEIILNYDLENKNELTSFLSEILENKVKIIKPKSNSSQYKILQNILENAKKALKKKIGEISKKSEILNKIADLFDTKEPINRIELYDNSHISGKFAIGAMVVANKDGLDKKSYRTFNIKGDQPKYGGDDYAMMREVLSRRLKRLDNSNKPSLIILDGGVGQLNAVHKVMKDTNINIPLAAMSKGENRNAGRETFHQLNKEPFTLERNDDAMKYMQVMRDEVHNLAINAHRKLRSKAIKYSSLDQIEGIGEKRKNTLLNYFGSFEKIKEATIDEIASIDNISKKLASKIYNEIH